MSVEGEAQMLLSVTQLTEGYDRRARKAVRSGGQMFAEKLKSDTPVSDEDHSGLGPLANHVKVGSVSIKTGDYSVAVGYDSSKGRTAHFPNSGTSKQSPQHFIEKTQSEMREPVLAEFIKDLKVN
ncbi:HK97-gp10 family putative phage morphogenesis protein [Liquorilactobacillus nagelii]|uniref:HK97-gp10 family putative phage morphogenesis protein n=1 Tax=Liquorilactobacillus nagelii TaxID=82688 RepID=UPI0039E9E6DB